MELNKQFTNYVIFIFSDYLIDLEKAMHFLVCIAFIACTQYRRNLIRSERPKHGLVVTRMSILDEEKTEAVYIGK